MSGVYLWRLVWFATLLNFGGDTKYLPMGFVWKLYMKACSICVLHPQVCNLSIHAQHLSSFKIALVGFLFPSRVWTNVVQVNFNNHIYTTHKSCGNVNHLHLHVSTFYTSNCIDVIYIYIYMNSYTKSLCKYLLNTLIWPCVNVLGHARKYIIKLLWVF